MFFKKKIDKYAQEKLDAYANAEDSLARLKKEQRATANKETKPRAPLFRRLALSLSVLAVVVLTFCFVWVPMTIGKGGTSTPAYDASVSSGDGGSLSGGSGGISESVGGIDDEPSAGYEPSVRDGAVPRIDYYKIGSAGSIKGSASGVCGYASDSGFSDIATANKTVSAGRMTAKAWNDNDHFPDWLALFKQATENEAGGKFASYASADWTFGNIRRVKVTVKEGQTPVAGARVEYVAPNQSAFVSRTDERGIAYVFMNEPTGSVTVKSGSATETVPFSEENNDLIVSLVGSESQANVIKIMFVIDATGSMGDEMEYIAAELTDVVERVTQSAAGVRIDLALLFYRDDGDQEKFAYSDFAVVSDSQGLQAQLAVLNAQSATGGGDYPEAVDEALLLAAGKDWGEENATKLAFLVLDAPPHNEQTKLENCYNAAMQAAEKGIRINPILCSGANLLCECVTRAIALATAGTNVFVTDDSGIGGAHLDPDLPNETVERLNDLLVRLIVGYHTGDFGTPVAYNQTEQA